MAGEPIKDKPLDKVVSVLDKVLGTDSVTQKTYNYEIQDIINLAQAVSGGVCNTSNVLDVQETVGNDFVAILNTLGSPWIVNPADVPIINVLEHTTTNFKASYIYKKTSTTVIKIGAGESQIVAGDFYVIRQTSDFGETNTLADAATNDGNLTGTAVGAALKVKSLKQGSNITITEDATSVTIATSGALGEVNTASSAGGTSLIKTKTVADLIFKGITGLYCDVGSNTNDVEITAWGKIVRTASFTVSTTDSQRTIHIDNGASAVIITVPDTLGLDFEMCVQQIGTGEVSFVTSGTAALTYTANKLKGQSATCLVETKGDDTNAILITGGTKV